jgi:hypothetical protein
MRRTRKAKAAMRAECRFDYSKTHPNRFAAGIKKEAGSVILDPDVAAVFHSSESVNAFLRSVISTLPRRWQSEQRPADNRLHSRKSAYYGLGRKENRARGSEEGNWRFLWPQGRRKAREQPATTPEQEGHYQYRAGGRQDRELKTSSTFLDALGSKQPAQNF